jgi:hypothetical protein
MLALLSVQILIILNQLLADLFGHAQVWKVKNGGVWKGAGPPK